MAVTARAQTPEPVSCKAIAAQATLSLTATALAEVPATADEKRVLGEFQRGVAEECGNAGGENCYTRKPGEQALPTQCPADPVRAWMATSARQIMPTQTKQNRATQLLQGLLGKAPEVVAALPPPPPPPPSSAAAGDLPPPPPPPSITPPPPPALERTEEPDDAPVLEGDDLLTRPLAGMSHRELRATQTLLEEQKPGLGLTIGMYAGGAGALTVGSFFIVNSIGYYGSTFGLVLGAVALTAGVGMIVIGTIALVYRLRSRAIYDTRLEEVRGLMHKPSRKAPSSTELFPLPTMMTVAQW